MTDETRYDVVIVGGGLIGSSVAYFLKMADSRTSVCVIEADPSYEFASTLRASGGARRLFSCPENIEMSNFSIEFIKTFPETMATKDGLAEVGWREKGYLFIVGQKDMPMLEASFEQQRTLGCEVYLLNQTELKQRFPSMNVSDLTAGNYSPRDGWCDPNSFLQGFKRKGKELGVKWVTDRVSAINTSGNKVTSVETASGRTIQAENLVNAGGAWSGVISKLAGMDLPIAGQRRFEHFFSPQSPVEPLPYVKDTARLAFRPEGKGYSGGLVSSDEPLGFNFEIDHDYFERVVWPALAHRFPQFEATKCHRTWSGLYELNTLDGNPVIGKWTGGAENLFVVAGFSGHGMMHAPAAGRGIAELITKGSFQTIDLSRLGYERVVAQEPYRELGIL